MKNNKWFRSFLIPICLLLIIAGIFVFKNKKEKSFTTPSANTIKINYLKEIAAANLDADIKYDTDINVKERFTEYTFLDDIKVPSSLTIKSKYLIYTKKLDENKEDYQNAPYNILHDYVVNYESEPSNDGLIEKHIIVAFSKDFEPLRDYFLGDEPLEVSKIKGIEVKIGNYNEMYISTFSYQGLNFDIETVGLAENEVIELLESIIK